ncbi:MAG TPA: RtcB family protein [Tepidisphaeraceae bacterium]|jgi:tRNA-splicing ligase RtcB|nr:RtcB family protein [Tepidisphaeraceae bacterium]
MSNQEIATLNTWLIEPMEQEVSGVVERLRRAPDVKHVAIMPDVHLAKEVTVGTVMASERLLYPQAVGGDIGCGMLAVALETRAERLEDGALAGRMLKELGRTVPTRRRHRSSAARWPEELEAGALSHPALIAAARDEGRLQLGTLGGGNHFVELQRDEEGRLWLMIHSGSRGMGQVIWDHHMTRAVAVGSGLRVVDFEKAEGRAYAADMQWARRYADANRRAMALAVERVAEEVMGCGVDWATLIAVDHNHVVREVHFGRELWVHRKGAMPAARGAAGVLPGSMGTESFHVEGTGCVESLKSSAHGAGRKMSREMARKSVSGHAFVRQMEGVWYDYRAARQLRDEAPAAYKDIRAVLRAQRELVKVRKVLRPVVSFKGR